MEKIDFIVSFTLANDKIEAKCKVPPQHIASAFMSLITKDLSKAQDLLINETVVNLDEVKKAFDKYPFAKMSLANAIMERLGLTNDVLVKEVEEQKN